MRFVIIIIVMQSTFFFHLKEFHRVDHLKNVCRITDAEEEIETNYQRMNLRVVVVLSKKKRRRQIFRNVFISVNMNTVNLVIKLKKKWLADINHSVIRYIVLLFYDKFLFVFTLSLSISLSLSFLLFKRYTLAIQLLSEIIEKRLINSIIYLLNTSSFYT